MSLGTVKVPTLAQLGEVAAELGLNFSEADLAAHLEALRPSFEGYNILDRMPDELPPVAYPRRPGRRPAPEENPHGAWYIKTEVPGAASGKLRKPCFHIVVPRSRFNEACTGPAPAASRTCRAASRTACRGKTRSRPARKSARSASQPAKAAVSR